MWYFLAFGAGVWVGATLMAMVQLGAQKDREAEDARRQEGELSEHWAEEVRRKMRL